MSSLYELTNDYMEVYNMLEDEEMDEQCIIDTLEAIGGEIEVKADNYAKLIKCIESDLNGTKKEMDRLTTRKTTLENRIKSLKNNLKASMEITGKTRFTTDLFSFNIQKNGGKRNLVLDADIDNLPTDYRIPQPDKVDGDKLREYIASVGIEQEDGSVTCEFAHLEPQRKSLRIK